ncbi:trypsin-like peptidase domain-containing protein [Streptomyces montanus]|uniref:Trypsin-like peptidase domain-containing protein n=1 Tax=Streptomyces montanus TaxID=2580423 RepID=A0A5R9FL49_9ACTN|nr:trypsin-like peptidase domain-containing protein [Streptomyces montanus]TLS42760.1 trypsin-like peptidase domain-containing protein [Streptomyces montanus]
MAMRSKGQRWLRTGAAMGARARSSLVSLLGSAHGEVVGSGVYLGEGLVLTCSHVVNEAIGRDWFAQDEPKGPSVEVAFPSAESCDPLAARPVTWIPARRTASDGAPPEPAQTGDAIWYGDLALLELPAGAPASVRPMDWAKMAQGQEVRAWYGGGQPFTYADGSVQSCDELLGFVDSQLRGAAINPGYSGGPLWCEDQGAAVGIVLGTMEPPAGSFGSGQVVRRTIVLPWQTIQAELGAAGTHATSTASGAPAPHNSPHRDGGQPLAPVDPATRHSLTALVTSLLADPGKRTEQGRRLADELDLETTQAAPSVEDIVEILVTRHRAIAAFTEGLPAGDRADTQKLLALGQAALIPGLLSVREHAWLLDLLSTDVRGRFPEAAREALPYTTLFDGPPVLADRSHEASDTRATDATDVGRLIAALEEFWGDSAPVPDGSPRVPALLRAVEYLAATCVPKQMHDFWEWSEQVAYRLGVAREALSERRDDAAEWARRRRERTGPPSPRLTVQLTRCSEETYRCAAWYDPGTGSSGAERQVVADDEPRESAEIVRLLHRVLVRESASAEPPAAVPLVEVLLDPEDLDVAVDQWENQASPYEVPLVLGAEYAVVVRCPEVRRRAPESLQHWRSRWAEIDRGGLLRLDHRHTTPRQVYGLLKADLAVARVIIDCPTQHREALRAACLVLGVPVVVWDRHATPGTTSDQLAALLLNGPVRGLPHRVRRQRARALAESVGAGPAALVPALVWDDASRPPPRPFWNDPTAEEPTP